MNSLNRRSGPVSAVLIISAALSVGEAHQPSTAPPTVAVNSIGPKVGDRIPPFALKDQTGKEWTRESIMGPKGALLVFFRSADW